MTKAPPVSAMTWALRTLQQASVMKTLQGPTSASVTGQRVGHSVHCRLKYRQAVTPLQQLLTYIHIYSVTHHMNYLWYNFDQNKQRFIIQHI